MCPNCHHTPAEWNVPKGMLSDFASRSAKAAAAGVKANFSSPQYRLKLRAAELLLLLAGKTELDLPERCLSDAVFAQRLYFVAAKRLHPDRNGGVHLQEWFQLQQAMATIWQA